MDPKDQARQDVRAFLEKNKDGLGWMSVDFIVMNVRMFAPQAAAKLLDSELRATVAVWRSLNGPIFSFPNPGSPNAPLPAAPESKITEAVKKAVTTVIDGVDIKHGDGKVNIGVGGVTAELKKGDATLAAGVSWGGTLSVEAEKGDFHFSGELSQDRWEIKLSYPEDTAVPDLSKLGKVFGEGEAAMRKIIGATASFKNLNDIPRIQEAIKPNVQPVKDAVEAVQGIAKAPAKGLSVGISVGSPDPMPGQTGIPPGVQVEATLTLRF